MRVGDDVGDGEIRRDVGLGEGCEGNDDQQRLGERRRAAERHQPRIAARGADQRQRALHQRDGQRENEREVAEFRNHVFRTAGLQARS